MIDRAPRRPSRARRGLVQAGALCLSIGAIATAATAATGPAAAATPSAPAPSPSLQWAIPNSHAGVQLRWFLKAAAHPPISNTAMESHFTAGFLGEVSPFSFNVELETLHEKGAWRVVTLDSTTTPSILLANAEIDGKRLGIELSVDRAGRIDGLYLSPATRFASVGHSWSQLNYDLHEIAPQVGFEAARVSSDGSCTTIDSYEPRLARPLGSTFKLYVLAAVDRAIAAGRLSWSTPVRLTSAAKSLPSGLLQVEGVGTTLTVAHLAQLMISSSDNTAADLLAELVGRAAVTAEVARTSGDASLDTPFLTTREFFGLELADYPHDADAYLRRSASGRLSYLGSTISSIPLARLDAAIGAQHAPRDVDRIGWFASPLAVCSILGELLRQSRAAGGAPIATALETNDGGLDLPSPSFSGVWFKGGSESGVLSLAYLAARPDGSHEAVVLELADPSEDLNGSTFTLDALSIVREAFLLSS